MCNMPTRIRGKIGGIEEHLRWLKGTQTGAKYPYRAQKKGFRLSTRGFAIPQREHPIYAILE